MRGLLPRSGCGAGRGSPRGQLMMASVLSEFRSRLVAGDLTSLALDALLERLAGLGLVRAGGRQRTDSTHVLHPAALTCCIQQHSVASEASPANQASGARPTPQLRRVAPGASPSISSGV
jgi:hypothetical protein